MRGAKEIYDCFVLHSQAFNLLITHYPLRNISTSILFPMPSVQARSSDPTPQTTPHALLPFLRLQSQTTLTRLYQRPSSCLSIFRSVLGFKRVEELR